MYVLQRTLGNRAAQQFLFRRGLGTAIATPASRSMVLRQDDPREAEQATRDPKTLSDPELRALYQQLLQASDPASEDYFVAVEAELHSREARKPSDGPASQSSSAVAGGHAPGGPYHPPEGTELSCSMADSCSDISLRINYLEHTIESHMQWDKDNPNPDYPNGRHAEEIADLQRASANCKAIYTTKCTNQPKFLPVPVPVPQAVEAGEGAATVAEGATTAAEVGEGVEVATEGGIGLVEILEGLGLALAL